MTIGKRQHFSTNRLKKLNIVSVNGVWKHDHAIHAPKAQEKLEIPLTDNPEIQMHDSNGEFEEPSLNSNSQILSQIWGGGARLAKYK